MNFLFLQTINSIYDIVWGLELLGHNVTIFEQTQFDPNNSIESDNIAFSNFLYSNKYNFVISYLFIPAISDCCFKLNIPYISITYDSPLVSLFTNSIYHNTNYTFIFDRMECERLQRLNIPHIYHLPLAVNLERVGALDITTQDERLYSHDISFVGNLYEDNFYNESIGFFPENLQLSLKLYLTKHLCDWTSLRQWPCLSDECVNFMKATFDFANWNPTDFLSDSNFFGILLLSRKLCEMERITILNYLSQYYKVDFYTNSTSKFLNNVNLHTGVDYYTVMNKIFYLSKINLNITLPSIESGIPQRVLDIMGSGGFVLTNYQPEIEEVFEIGKDIEVFHTLEELYEKCSYYLTHEKERLTIAMNGYIKIRNNFSYNRLLKKIISTVQEELQ